MLCTKNSIERMKSKKLYIFSFQQNQIRNISKQKRVTSVNTLLDEASFHIMQYRNMSDFHYFLKLYDTFECLAHSFISKFCWEKHKNDGGDLVIIIVRFRMKDSIRQNKNLFRRMNFIKYKFLQC